jgi:hypothetical protein
MKTTLTALVMTGALALGGCKVIEQHPDGSRSHYGHFSQNGARYDTCVTESQSVAGTTERRVFAVLDDAVFVRNPVPAPYSVEGVERVAKGAARASPPYTSGTIRYIKAGSSIVGCTWDMDARPSHDLPPVTAAPSPAYEPCGSAQIIAAARLLDRAAQSSNSVLSQQQ